MIVEDTLSTEDRSTTMMETILTRDQRTTSHRVLDRAAQNSPSTSSTILTLKQTKPQESTIHRDATEVTTTRITCAQRHLQRESYPIPTFYDDRGIWSSRNASVTATTWLRLSGLLVILLVVSVDSAPIRMNLQRHRFATPPKWVNPCGLASDDVEGDTDVVQLRDEQLLAQVVVQAKTALMHAQLFRDAFIKDTFNVDFNDLHSTWKDNHYDWLPTSEAMPKQLGENLTQEYLDTLELDTTLLNTYEYMQKYAVGLEQIVWDQEDRKLSYREQFKETEFKLRTVLCELQVAIMERGVTPRPDITRDIMPPEYRAVSFSATYRNLRDWMIFRDYMNGLEYLVQVFEHFRRRLES